MFFLCFCFGFVRKVPLAALLTLQPLHPIHLKALNTTILHLNILHAPEPLTCPSPPMLTFSQACCFDHNSLVLISTG
jgi:hypothetical protein